MSEAQVPTPTAVAAEPRSPDEALQHEVMAELKWDARVQPNEIGVSARDGIVTLAGWVDSYAKRWAAEEAAHRVRGVKAVVNDIEVRLPSASQRPDPDIAAAILRALKWQSLVPPDEIRVTVSNGWVTLAGEVDKDFQRADAERVARRIKGVRGVSNLIRVVGPGGPSADEIKRRIEDALGRSARIEPGRVSVGVQGDTVVLRGTVRAWADREQAEEAAWSAPGVRSVNNEIMIVAH